MKALYNRVGGACPSKLVNAWTISLGSKKYVVTPAHVALHFQNNTFQKSKFLEPLWKYEWKIPRLYSLTSSFLYDCAWAEIPSSTPALDGWDGVL